MGKPIENDNNAKEFWENLADASPLDSETQVALRELLGVSEDPMQNGDLLNALAGKADANTTASELAGKADLTALNFTNTAVESITDTLSSKQVGYLRSYRENQLSSLSDLFTLDGLTATENLYSSSGTNPLVIIDGVAELYDNPSYSPNDWSNVPAYGVYTPVMYAVPILPASLTYVRLEGSHYPSHTFMNNPSVDKIVSLFSWMAGQYAMTTPRQGVTRIIDASSSDYLNIVFDENFCGNYDNLINAGWTIYLPNYNQPAGDYGDTAVSTNSNMQHATWAIGNPDYPSASDPDRLYLFADDVFPEQATPTDSVNIGDTPDFPRSAMHTLTTDFSSSYFQATVTKFNGSYLVAAL